MRLNTDGIVIREYQTGEADRLVTVLTRDSGILRAFVRGARSVKSKTLSGTQLFAYSKISLYQNRETYIIDEAEPIEVFFNLRSDLISLTLAQYFCELTAELAPESYSAEEFLRLLLNSLHLLSSNKLPTHQVKAAFEMRMLCLAGYMPNLVACDICGKFQDDPMFFDRVSGMLYCSGCKRPTLCEQLSIGVVTAMRHICYAEFEKLFSFSLSPDGLRQLSETTERYLLAQTQKNYKTLDFLKKLS